MEETQRLERIIGDLLDLARLEGGGTAIHQSRVEVAGLFQRVAARHERDLHARRIELVQHVDRDAGTLVGDPDRLEQAIQNLAANALRHTPEGGTITLSAERAGDAIRLSVRDSGSGIAAEQLPHIFDRFYKGDASRKSAGGSGLGLSIVRAIVERHGGTITARNDNGAVFEIVLPAGVSIVLVARRVRRGPVEPRRVDRHVWPDLLEHVVFCPSVHVSTRWCGIFTPLTSR